MGGKSNVVKGPLDPFEVNPMSDRLLGRASREIMIPFVTDDWLHLMAPSDFQEIFSHIRGCLRDMEFELGRWEGGLDYYKSLARMADLVRHTNEATKFVRDRAKAAAKERKVKAVPRWGAERVDSARESIASQPEESYLGNGKKIA